MVHRSDHGLLAWRGIVLAGACLCVGITCPTARCQPAANDDELRARFDREAVEALGRYAIAIKELQGEVRSKQTTGSEGKTFEYRSRTVMKRNGINAIVLQYGSSVDPEGKEQTHPPTAFCECEHYLFALRQQKDSKWQRTQLGSRDGVLGPVPLGVESFIRNQNYGLDRVWNSTLVDKLRKPDFKVTRCVHISRGQEDLAELGFADPSGGITEGTLVLDPNHYWCVRSSDWTVERPKQMTYRTTFTADEISFRNGLPIPKKTTTEFSYRFADGRVQKGASTTEYDLSIPWWKPAASEFRLPAFGLKELPGYAPPTNYFAWIAAIAGVLLVAAGGIALLFRRRPVSVRSTRATQPSATPAEGETAATPPLKPALPGNRRIALAAVALLALIGLGIGLAVMAGRTQADRFPAETAALQSLIDDFKLEDEAHKHDSDGRVNDLLLEGPRFKDDAVAFAGKFPMLEGMSIMGSAITDEGLEKLPVLKCLNRINIMAPAITDRGLLALRKMPSLQDVWLVENDKLTAAGRENLNKTNPAVRLHVMNRPQNAKK